MPEARTDFSPPATELSTQATPPGPPINMQAVMPTAAATTAAQFSTSQLLWDAAKAMMSVISSAVVTSRGGNVEASHIAVDGRVWRRHAGGGDQSQEGKKITHGEDESQVVYDITVELW